MTVTKYIYDGEKVLQETDGSNVTKKQYTSSLGRYGDLLSEYDGTSTEYYEPDALGSTDALIDQTQTQTDKWKYRAFGVATQTQISTSTPFTWVGRQDYFSDLETGLYMLGAGTRHYDPTVLQPLSKDPLGIMAGDANDRRYVGNNPVNAVDPSGNLPFGPKCPARVQKLCVARGDTLNKDLPNQIEKSRDKITDLKKTLQKFKMNNDWDSFGAVLNEIAEEESKIYAARILLSGLRQTYRSCAEFENWQRSIRNRVLQLNRGSFLSAELWQVLEGLSQFAPPWVRFFILNRLERNISVRAGYVQVMRLLRDFGCEVTDNGPCVIED